MTLDHGRVQAVFLAGLELKSPASRAAFLDRECGGDDELRARIEALLIAHERPDGLLDRPIVVSGEPASIIRPPGPRRAEETDGHR